MTQSFCGFFTSAHREKLLDIIRQIRPESVPSVPSLKRHSRILPSTVLRLCVSAFYLEIEAVGFIHRSNKAGNVVQRNIEEHSRNHICPEKELNIYLCVCSRARFVCVCVFSVACGRNLACSLAYLTCNAYAPCCVVICGPCGFTKFFDIIL